MLSKKKALALCSVAQLPDSKTLPKVGTFFALRGAWDNKRVCVRVDQDGTVWCQNVGRIFADGRYVPAKRTKISRVRYWRNSDGSDLIRWPSRSGWVPVAPTGRAPKGKFRVLDSYYTPAQLAERRERKERDKVWRKEALARAIANKANAEDLLRQAERDIAYYSR